MDDELQQHHGGRGFKRGADLIRYASILVALVAIMLTLLPWYAGHKLDESLRQAEAGYQVDALHTARRAATLNPTSISALFILAGAQQRIGWAEDAKRSLLKATEMQPLNYQVWEQLALYEKNYWDRPEDAREHFNRAISLNPRDENLRLEAESASTARASLVAAGEGH